MKYSKVTPAFALCSFIVFSSSAMAVPITFSFEMQAFPDTIASFALGGLPSTLELTVDNGSSSVSNQSYTNTDILSMSLMIGSEATAFTIGATGVFADIRGLATWIVTDALGRPTLDLTGTDRALIALSSISPTFEFLQLSSNYDVNFFSVVQADGDIGSFGVFDGPPAASIGTFVSCVSCTFDAEPPVSVPEPNTLALFGVGLFGFGLLWRRRKVQILLST